MHRRNRESPETQPILSCHLQQIFQGVNAYLMLFSAESIFRYYQSESDPFLHNSAGERFIAVGDI